MSTVAVLPNSEAVLIAFLKSRTALSALSGDCVGTVVQPAWTGYAIRVTKVGGSPSSWYGDSPLLQIDCWSSNDDASGLQSATLAAAVAAELYDLPGQHGNVWISNVNIETGPIREADEQNRPRYRVDISFDAHNTP